MTNYTLQITRKATKQLVQIERYIAEAKSPRIAAGYIERIKDSCAAILLAPQMGTRRDHVRPGLRTIGMEGRVTIAFRVEGKVVRILSIAYGGRQYESDFKPKR